MISDELKNLLIQVITSWQVIAVTIGLVVYMCLVTYVARTHHRPAVSKSRPQKAKAAAKEKDSKKEEFDTSDILEE